MSFEDAIREVHSSVTAEATDDMRNQILSAKSVNALLSISPFLESGDCGIEVLTWFRTFMLDALDGKKPELKAVTRVLIDCVESDVEQLTVEHLRETRIS